MSELLEIELSNFEGPLDLLIHLIHKNEMNIYDISISLITDKFINALGNLSDIDIELASDFVQMASYLVYLKSRMLLPQDHDGEDEADVEEEKFMLTQRLLEYSYYREIATLLTKYEKISNRYLARNECLVVANRFYGNDDSYNLAKLYFSNLEKKPKHVFVKNDRIDIRTIIVKLREMVFNNEFILWEDLCSECSDKREVAVTMLAILELVQLNVIIALQKEPFGNIIVRKS